MNNFIDQLAKEVEQRIINGGKLKPVDGGKNEIKEGQQLRGVVKWFNSIRGYGFIGVDEIDNDVFVHVVNVGDEFMDGNHARLKEGDKVKFLVCWNHNKEGWYAKDVRRAE